MLAEVSYSTASAIETDAKTIADNNMKISPFFTNYFKEMK
jgi:hypothetical protein